MKIKNLGLISYADALALMNELHAEVATNENHAGYILALEHPPTVTMGNRLLYEDLLVKPEELKFKGVSFFKTDRGGSATVHEPGQLVVYPIIKLPHYNLSVKSYIACLEEAMIRACAHFGISAGRDSINPGIWIGDQKIGAVGVRVSHRVSKHGIAFNINNTLATFAHIIPCGLSTRGITSLQNEIIKKAKLLSQDPLIKLDFEQIKQYLVSELVKLLKSV